MSSFVYKLFYTKNRKQIGFGLIIAILWIGQLINWFGLDLPPSNEQIKLGLINVNIIRAFSAGLVVSGLFYFYRFIQKRFGDLTAVLSIGLLIMSPALMSIWYERPIYSVLFFFLSIIINRLQLKWWFVLGILLIVFNSRMWGSSMPFTREISLEKSINEVNKRFMGEDSLSESIKFPLVFRRAAYNKYFILADDFLRMQLSFFDIDSWFFQEIHPSGAKSQVMFYWPVVVAFFIGVWQVVRATKDKQKIVLWLLIISIVFFNYSDGPVYLRNLLTLIPIAIISGEGFGVIKSWRWLYVFLLMLTAYGCQANWYDLKNRIGFWFDNRPLAYDFIYKNISFDFSKVHVSNLIGDSKKYCQYYWEDRCLSEKIDFSGFDLKEKNPEAGLYAGFIGEYLGSDYNNNFGDGWREKIENKGLKIVKTMKLNDSIAFKYGDYLVIAKKE